ncbi:MAG TPA: hypothetical protein VFB13_10410 [Reyranella sp.]|nr:hypothetical protein [Reyranella sp.]
MLGLLMAACAAPAVAQTSQEANGVTILRGASAPPPPPAPPIIQQPPPTVIVQPAPTVQYPYAMTFSPFYFFPVSPLLHHHRHR